MLWVCTHGRVGSLRQIRSGSPPCSAQDGSASGFHYGQYRCEKRGGSGRLGGGACGSHDEDHDHDDHWNPPLEHPLLRRWSGRWRTGQVSSNSICEGQVPPGRALSLVGDGIARRLACCAVPVSQTGFSFKLPRRRGVLKSEHVTGTCQQSGHSVDQLRAETRGGSQPGAARTMADGGSPAA